MIKFWGKFRYDQSSLYVDAVPESRINRNQSCFPYECSEVILQLTQEALIPRTKRSKSRESGVFSSV